MAGTIRAGIGGWTFEPWRGIFYPPGTRQADELAFASRKLAVIEVNGTYYSSQKPQTFAKWAAETPDGFVFSLKASRFCTNRRILADAGESIDRFFSQGIAELGDRLGPILWQLAPTKAFDAADMAGFLALLPRRLNDRPLRHCLEARHQSFVDPAFVELCRKRGVAICLADHPTYPMIADVTTDFVYARLMRGSDDIETCYPEAGLDVWARRCEDFARGAAGDLPQLAPDTKSAAAARDVFVYFITAGKVRAPAGAMALQARVASSPSARP
jgi:uncharacterized protein YecE (DUF72 family)